HRDPKPPRQIDDAVPKELERICLRCLGKRMVDRYCSATDLAADLRAWLAEAAASPTVPRPAAGGPADAPPLLPKGLRPFDGQDAECFLELLPGPRGRDGLPESIRFWKSALEGRGAEPPFSVGPLYGPSGGA